MGNDQRGKAAVAQCDLRAYYDMLPVLLIIEWLKTRGVSSALLFAILCFQCLPKVTLRVGCSEAVLDRRGRGLTGSRVAVALGRIPVQDVLVFLDDRLRTHGLA